MSKGASGDSLTPAVIRPAAPGDEEALTEIAFSAKRYWGYPDAYFEVWRDELTITEPYIRNNTVFVSLLNRGITGFYSLVNIPSDRLIGGIRVDKGWWLDHIFVVPERIRTGIGTLLVSHMKAICRTRGIERVLIFADPHSEGFYYKLGAEKIRDSKSSIPGRTIPVLGLFLERRPENTKEEP